MSDNTIIDVWNVQTFDGELLQFLESQASLVLSYFKAEQRIMIERERSNHRGIYPSNPFSSAFRDLENCTAMILESRTMRVWHYTRLTDREVKEILSSGIELSTIDTLKRRLVGLVSEQCIDEKQARWIFDGSPFNGEQHQIRTNSFWAASHPIDYRDAGVKPLLEYWGGEVASFPMQDDDELLDLLKKVGKARIIELTVPLTAVSQISSAARNVVSTFSQARGLKGDFQGFDVCVVRNLARDSVVAIHSDGDESFVNVGRLCPKAFS